MTPSINQMQRLDIFCRVIDNFGDIGVCWRLARQLASEYPYQVRLWVDELAALTQIWPAIQNIHEQIVENIEVRRWIGDFEDITPADIIIETFACHLPEKYQIAMKQTGRQPIWFNLEYLSAEDWVESCHGLISTHPQLGLKKIFFFPGFTTKTGGLLREKSLIEARNAFNKNNNGESKANAFLQQLGIQRPDNGILISLFGYENAAIGSLIDTWTHSSKPVLCLVPTGRILTSINEHLDKTLVCGDECIQESLHLKVIPFLTQTQYDQLLWACDVNFIRGEDSFVRAQWAGKPFIWHIYPQEDDIHLIKLQAFLDHYTKQMDNPAPLISLWHEWNKGVDCRATWNACLEDMANWLKHSQNWCNYLCEQDDLAANMVHFCQKTL